MKKLLYAATISTLLSSCAAPNTMMINPTTQQYQVCAASGWGWAGTPLALMTHENCVESMRSIGFVPVDEYKKQYTKYGTNTQPSTITNDNLAPLKLRITATEPGAQVYAGTNKYNLTYIGVTPFIKGHPTPGPAAFWSNECYQAKKEGFEDSEIRCFKPSYEDRYVELVMARK